MVVDPVKELGITPKYNFSDFYTLQKLVTGLESILIIGKGITLQAYGSSSELECKNWTITAKFSFRGISQIQLSTNLDYYSCREENHAVGVTRPSKNLAFNILSLFLNIVLLFSFAKIIASKIAWNKMVFLVCKKRLDWDGSNSFKVRETTLI